MTTPLQHIRNTYYDVKYIELYDYYYTNRAKHSINCNQHPSIPHPYVVLIPDKEFMVNLMEGDELGPPKKALFSFSHVMPVTKPGVTYDGFTRINVKKYNIECMDTTANKYINDWYKPESNTDASFYVKLYKEPTYLPSIGKEVMGYMVYEKYVTLMNAGFNYTPLTYNP